MSRVIVVGAGPGGATLAYLLARRGIEVVLFERQSDFSREFRGEALLPSGLEPFEQMGLWEQLDTVPHVKLAGVGIYFNGRLKGRANFDTDALGPLAPRWTSQPALLEMLVGEAAKHSSFRFERGVRVRGLIERDGRFVGVTLANDREEYGDLIVGADGRTSVVRRQAEFEVDADRLPMDVVWCKLPLPDFLRDDPHLRAYVGHGHLLLAAPVYDDHVQMAWIVAKGSLGETRSRGMPELLEEMSAHVSPDLAEHIRAHKDGSVQPFLLSTVSDRVRNWTRPGLLVIGDAAHTMSPVGGQGLNIAIRDALVAANHLVPAIESGAAPDEIDAATHRVEQERKPEVSSVQRMQALPPPIILRDAWWSQWLLAAVTTVLPSQLSRSGLFRRFAFGVREVRLRV